MSKAQELHNALIIKQRANGESFYCLADNSPEWMNEVIRECRGDELPNDWRYSFIKEAAAALMDMNWPLQEADDLYLEADIYDLVS